MNAVILALVALTAVSACAAGRPRLPWTVENVQAVAAKCHLQGLTVDSRGIAGGGLHQLGKEPSIEAKYRCLKRRIDLPPDFILLTG